MGPGGSEAQFRGEPSQIVFYVDVVEGVGEANRKLQSASARQQHLKRALRAHAIAIEKRWMGGLGAYQIIAAVVRRSDNNVVAVERLERAFKNRSRQMRAVAVEGNDALPARRCEVCKDRRQACRQALALFAPLHSPRLDFPSTTLSSSTSEAGHIMATSTALNESASAIVSCKRQQ